MKKVSDYQQNPAYSDLISNVVQPLGILPRVDLYSTHTLGSTNIIQSHAITMKSILVSGSCNLRVKKVFNDTFSIFDVQTRPTNCLCLKSDTV